MNNNPLVSAIIIFLNEEKFLAEAIGSVFAQTYSNWELLLVDDGSADRSIEIARSYAEQYRDKIPYLEHAGHETRGMSAARNLGLRHARGEYIAFLDADDVWLPHKLKQQLQILNAYPAAGMVYGSPQLWHGWTGHPEDIERDSLQRIGVQPDSLVQPPTLLVRYLDRKAITPAPSDVLLRHEIVKRAGGFEDSFRGMYEDQLFFAKVCLKTPVFVSSECWVRHRQHCDSACSVWRRTGEYYSPQSTLTYLNWMEAYLSREGFKNTEVWKILQSALWPYRHPTLYSLLRRKQRYKKQVGETLKQIGKRTLPVSVQRWLLAQWRAEAQ